MAFRSSFVSKRHDSPQQVQDKHIGDSCDGGIDRKIATEQRATYTTKRISRVSRFSRAACHCFTRLHKREEGLEVRPW